MDRKPLSNISPTFPTIFCAGLIMLVIVPPLGFLLLVAAGVNYLLRKSKVDRRKDAIRRVAAQRARRERILAFKALP